MATWSYPDRGWVLWLTNSVARLIRVDRLLPMCVCVSSRGRKVRWAHDTWLFHHGLVCTRGWMHLNKRDTEHHLEIESKHWYRREFEWHANEFEMWLQHHLCLSITFIQSNKAHTHTSGFHLLLRYTARRVKHTPENTSPEPPQVHTIPFHSVTLPSHSVTFLNNYLSLHTHIESSDDD